MKEGNTINYGLKDDAFFSQSIPKLKRLDQPYLAKFITLTNHFPFLLDEKDKSWTTTVTSEPVVNRYLATVNYMDQSLKTFFQSLKNENLYENTMFVLYGDHYGIFPEYEKGVNELLDQPDTILSHVKNQQVPLIIHIPGIKGKEMKQTTGQIDVRSKVLHLLGIDTSQFMSFSENILSESYHPFVVFRDGNFITESMMYINGECYDTMGGSIVPKDQCAKGREKARNELQLSDRVIKGDWLRFLNE